MGKRSRRQFLAIVGAATAGYSILGAAQHRAKTHRIGFLTHYSQADRPVERNRPFIHDAFRKAGYKPESDVVFEWRFADGNHQRLADLAADLVRLKVDVILAWGDFAAHAAARVTKTIPIVVHNFSRNPAEVGLARSLARPERNLTGTLYNTDPVGDVVKAYEVLKQALPSATRVASIWWPWAPNAEELVAQMHSRVHKELGIAIVSFTVSGPDEVPSALNRIAELKPDALYVQVSAVTSGRLREISEFATRHKLATISNTPGFVMDGGLLYYGPNPRYQWERTVSYVVRILRGAKPGDLPIELPDRFEFVFNAKTAKAIGYKLPSHLQLRVDRIVE